VFAFGRRQRIVALGALLLLSACRAIEVEELPGPPATDAALTNPLTVVVWNTHKKTGADLRGEIGSFVRERQADLILLQEYNEDLSDLDVMGGYFANSWHYPWIGGKTIGVTTLSPVRPSAVTSLQTKHREFVVTAPKTSLVTRYPLSDGTSLLVANVHLLTFERLGTSNFQAQLADLEGAIAAHDGPMIVAGDFNTWSHERLASDGKEAGNGCSTEPTTRNRPPCRAPAAKMTAQAASRH
jgi:endonuclease/exonuclease/phosphatase (EEP) superfamily protein YafD